MDIKQILKFTDHTLLKADATPQQLEVTALDAKKYGCASVCIPPFFVKEAVSAVGKDFSVCTVIGFPNGYNPTSVKLAETECALADGAREIDVVINVGKLLGGDFIYVKNEIDEIKRVAGNNIVKVIVETGLLDEKAKIEICKIVSDSAADYIKTSTGYAGGAKKEDILLFKRHIRPSLKIKASGGIRTLREAEEFLSLGCQRIGASAVVAAAKEML